MNFLAKILLFIFIFAQSAPSIIYLVDSDNDFSISIAEDEEKSKEEKEFKTEFIVNENGYNTIVNSEISNITPHNYLMKEYHIVSSIDILPPEKV
jgi:hypothetical protein